MKANHFGKLKKENGKLIPFKKADEILFDQFKSALNEGAVVEFYAEEVHDDGSLAQLAKIHAMIRQLSNHSGFTFEEMKLLIKEQAGLCLSRTVAGKEYFLCKSFGDCDKDELSAAIKGAQEIGIKINYPIQ